MVGVSGIGGMGGKMTCKTCGVAYAGDMDILTIGSKWRLTATGALAFSCRCGTEVQLKKNDWEGYSPQFAPAGSKDVGIFPALFHKRLPGLSPAANRIKLAVQRSETTNDQIASLFRDEPLVASRVLFMANAALDASAERRGLTAVSVNPKPGSANTNIRSMSHAIAVLGRKSLVNLLTISDIASLPFKDCHYRRTSFLKDVLSSAYASDFIATKFPVAGVSSEDAYFGAALSLIGRAVQAICYTSRVNKLIEIMSSYRGVSWDEAEKSIAGLPPAAALGRVVAAVWDLGGDSYIFSNLIIKTGISYNELAQPLSAVEALAAGRILGALAMEPNSVSGKEVQDIRARLGLGEAELKAMAKSAGYVVTERIKSMSDEFGGGGAPTSGAA